MSARQAGAVISTLGLAILLLARSLDVPLLRGVGFLALLAPPLALAGKRKGATERRDNGLDGQRAVLLVAVVLSLLLVVIGAGVLLPEETRAMDRLFSQPIVLLCFWLLAMAYVVLWGRGPRRS